jgi:hypothetical protein
MTHEDWKRLSQPSPTGRFEARQRGAGHARGLWLLVGVLLGIGVGILLSVVGLVLFLRSVGPFQL